MQSHDIWTPVASISFKVEDFIVLFIQLKANSKIFFLIGKSSAVETLVRTFGDGA